MRGLCYEFSPPHMEVPKYLIVTASAFLQFTISRNMHQSLSDKDNISEETVALSCALHRNRVDGRVLIGWHEWNESAGKNCGIAKGALADSGSTLSVGVLALTGLDVGVNEGRMSPNALVNYVSFESGLRVNDN